MILSNDTFCLILALLMIGAIIFIANALLFYLKSFFGDGVWIERMFKGAQFVVFFGTTFSVCAIKAWLSKTFF